MKSSKTKIPFSCIAVISFLVMAAGSFSCQRASFVEKPLFDDLITKETITANCNCTVPFKFIATEKDGNKIYSADFQVPNRDAGNYYFCTIRIARAGDLLDPEVYLRAYEREKKEKHDRGKKYFSYYFPAIGKRALLYIDGFGPGGGGYSLVFTTSDERFDVSIRNSMLLSDETGELEVDIHKLAEHISAGYDRRTRK